MFSTSAAGAYLLIFALAIGAATFIENDYGTSAAQKYVFKARWFEVLLILFGITIAVNIFRFRLIQQKKWATLLFHASILIILLGAGITRYFGYEGVMGIREGATSNTFLSAEPYINFEAHQNDRKFRFAEPVLFSSLGKNTFNARYQIGGEDITVTLTDFIPNPEETIEDDPTGIPVIKIVIGGAGGREEIPIRQGDTRNIYGTLFNFTPNEMPGAFNMRWDGGQLLFKADVPYTQMVMATQTRDTIPPGSWQELKLRSLYSDGAHNFVFGDFKPSAKVSIRSSGTKIASDSRVALQLQVQANNAPAQEIMIVGTQGQEGTPRTVNIGRTALSIAYGAQKSTLPFSIQLRDFILEKYPGTENASSYASEITLTDPRANVTRNVRIFMNNILDYDGYRFFQSSFDPDERGTYLSVNHDFWGTWISYIGYILLTIGMILTLFDAKSRFQRLNEQLKTMRQSNKTTVVLLALMAGSIQSMGQSVTAPVVIAPAHAALFGRLAVQDYKGRCKPMNTYTSEIMRKIARKEAMYGLNSDQIVLGMAVQPEAWYDVPLIKLGKHEEIQQLIHPRQELATYNDFFEPSGEYKLKDQIRAAYNKPPRDRGVLEKELIKIDEKLNICGMIFSGSFMKMFPVPGDATNNWASPEINHQHQEGADLPFFLKYYQAYITTLRASAQSNNYAQPDQLMQELALFQQKNGAAVLPSEGQLNAELLLNKLNIFNRLGTAYGLLSLSFLGLLFFSVFRPKADVKRMSKILLGLLLAGFLFHTLGLGLRWYVSERAPWSNGYESMIYIGWTTVLAGLVFSRKSTGGLAATSVLAATIMMVAAMSWLDPEITPLVPVLNSYWLTIHVSLEAGSYGFLVLGAIIGVINLILMVVATAQNRERVYSIIKELSITSEMTVTGGLMMLSIGTYLGGVWANESWGRYWGWDAKETWALVSILVYAFILHMRFIPGLRGMLAYNIANLFGWASIMMTYFGVNYYLSGLHSYAAGDPVPVPSFVYYGVFSLTVLSLLAFWKHRGHTSGTDASKGNVIAAAE